MWMMRSPARASPALSEPSTRGCALCSMRACACQNGDSSCRTAEVEDLAQAGALRRIARLWRGGVQQHVARAAHPQCGHQAPHLLTRMLVAAGPALLLLQCSTRTAQLRIHLPPC